MNKVVTFIICLALAGSIGVNAYSLLKLHDVENVLTVTYTRTQDLTDAVNQQTALLNQQKEVNEAQRDVNETFNEVLEALTGVS
jgi:uncharacterized protein YggE